MRSLFVIMLASAGARAEPTVPMKPIADRAAACEALKPGPKAMCSTAGKLAVAGLGTVELHVAKAVGATRYAPVVVKASGTVWMSEPGDGPCAPISGAW